jgi:hypothetical protein
MKVTISRMMVVSRQEAFGETAAPVPDIIDKCIIHIFEEKIQRVLCTTA